MPRALLLLIMLRLRAQLRRPKINLRTPRGVICTCRGLFIFVMWLGGGLVGMFLQHENHTESGRIRTVAPLVMLGFCVLSLIRSDASKTLVFSPAEIDQLFAGPFGRRQ